VPETLEPPVNSRRIYTETERETVKLMVMQGVRYPIIAAETGISLQTVKNWACREKWNQPMRTAQLIAEARTVKIVARETTSQLASASQALREVFASTLAQHADALAKVAVKPNLKHLKRVGEAIEPLARTAKIVHDWGAGSIQGVILAGSLEVDKGDQPRALDVTSAVEQVEPQAVVCGASPVKDPIERMDDSPTPAPAAPDPTPQG
jgi:transposase